MSQSADGGWYQCIVTQGIHVIGNGISKLEVKSSVRPRSRREVEAASAETTVTARGGTGVADDGSRRRQPYFISVSPDQRISPGGSFKLKCIASGNPLPRLAWLLNGEVLVSLKYLWRIYLLNITQCSILLRSYALHCPFCEDKDLKLEHAFANSESLF